MTNYQYPIPNQILIFNSQFKLDIKSFDIDWTLDIR